MDRIHLSRNVTLKFKSATQQGTELKPRGLWYGIGLSWVKWLKMEMPHWLSEHMFKVDVNTSRVLVLNTRSKVLEFHDKYGVNKGSKLLNYVDWEKVALKYSGIEFNPYFRDLRMVLLWYSVIDVPSGCVWRKDAVRKITKVK